MKEAAQPETGGTCFITIADMHRLTKHLWLGLPYAAFRRPSVPAALRTSDKSLHCRKSAELCMHPLRTH